ncbi:MAG: hypothetical protein BWY56_02441 [Acidobacteria bacterium ADurb.Bin340]|nr:MAG: hypothetical protein BWY56_02441 [Acidobacteria bacterium ADurb.Bin340]
MSCRRGRADTGSFVWRVDSTRCPVMAARTAMEAVSPSRISPMRMMSGSWRRMERSPAAKVSPDFTFTCTWVMRGSSYSTGSSTVTMQRSDPLMLLRAEYSVVVFPLPVGPVTRITPWGRCSSRRNCSKMRSGMPSWSSPITSLVLSRKRSTTFSPWVLGRKLARTSNRRRPTPNWNLPSWGSRVSAMFTSARIFRRATTACWTALGRLGPWTRVPSTRYRVSMVRSEGWTCRSVARSRMAFTMSWSTRRTTGNSAWRSRPSPMAAWMASSMTSSMVFRSP